MIITTLLTLINREDKKLTFAGQGKTFVLWENKYTELPEKLDLGKQYIVKLSAKKVEGQWNTQVFLSSIEKADKVYEDQYECKAKVTGIITNIDSWETEMDDFDLPYLSKKLTRSKVRVDNGKTSLELYCFGANTLVKGNKYSFLVNLIMSKPYDHKGVLVDDEAYCFTTEDGEVVVKKYLEFKIIKATEIV